MNPEEIINLVCKTLELDKDILLSKKKGGKNPRKYIDARMIICYLIRFHNKKDYSYRHIAEMFNRTLSGGKGDHVCAMYWEWVCKDLLITDLKFKEKFDKVELKIKP